MQIKERDGFIMKTCPNCKNKHDKKVTEYCCREVEVKCVICNENYSYICRKTIKKTCSHKCSAKLKNNKCLNCGELCKGKYCKKNIKIKCKYCKKDSIKKCQKNISLYCNGGCAAKDPETIEKAKKTQLKNHGGVYAFNTEKQKKTMIEKYGHKTPAKNEIIKEKIRRTMLEKYSINANKK